MMDCSLSEPLCWVSISLMTVAYAFVTFVIILMVNLWLPFTSSNLMKKPQSILLKIWEILSHPTEVVALLKFKFSHKIPELGPLNPSQKYCYDTLNHVSRSFAAVIQELSPELREPICIFYLALRALDTVEDDVSIDVQKKCPMLISFYENLYNREWNLRPGYGKGHEKDLLENFHHVSEVFLSLKPEHQQVIADITARMGKGMADFALKEVVTHKEYELYCHYVAGLVGIGLSKMFAHSGLEDKSFLTAEELSNSMGLFLQKTNIIRDYLEDINESPPRIFYPREIWSKYAEKFEDFKEEKYAKEAVQCLNDMVTDAMKHIPDCLEYMHRLKDKKVFAFCAIPQVMAIATLAKCYNNHDVFTGVVKIRKGLAVKMIMETTEFETACNYFAHFIEQVGKSIPANDPNANKMKQYIDTARQSCSDYLKMARSRKTVAAN